MTNEEIMAHQASELAFRATPIGAAFARFDSALARAWQIDSQAGYADNVSDKRLREVWEVEAAARKAFRAELATLIARASDRQGDE